MMIHTLDSWSRACDRWEAKLASNTFDKGLFKKGMEAFALRCGHGLAQSGSRKLFLATWVLSAWWGALTRVIMVAFAAPFLMPIDYAGQALVEWGRWGTTASLRGFPHSCAGLTGSILRLGVSLLLDVVQSLIMWIGGACLAHMARLAAAQTLELRPEWTPRARLWSAMGLNAFDLMAQFGARDLPYANGGGDLRRIESLGYRSLGVEQFAECATLPVGLAGSIWGVASPCAPWRTHREIILAHLNRHYGPSVEESHWLDWTLALSEARALGQKGGAQKRSPEPTEGGAVPRPNGRKRL